MEDFDRGQCKRIYRELFLLHDSGKPLRFHNEATTFLRMLERTKHCDHYKDLWCLRNEYYMHIDRCIFNDAQDYRDMGPYFEERLNKKLHELHGKTHDSLYSALTWKDRLAWKLFQ